MTAWLHTLCLFGLVLPLAIAAAGACAFAGWVAYLKWLARSDPLLRLPGADGGSCVQTMGDDVEEWARKHANGDNARGATPRNLHFPGLWPFERRSRLLTLDFAVISHILNSPHFEKPHESRAFLTKLVGKGIFVAEGAEHKVLRKAYAPAFAMPFLRSLSPMMLRKADQLCGLWSSEIKGSQHEGAAVVDVNSWLGRATLDVVAAAGFGHDVNSVADPQNSIYGAYRRVMEVVENGKGAFKVYLSLHFPWVHRIFPDDVSKAFDAAHATIIDAGKSLLRLGSPAEDEEKSASGAPPALLKSILRNITPPQGLSDSELLGQLSTFLFNGSDSTGSSIAWALHYLSNDKDVQDALREELRGVPTNAERVSALDRLPLLDRVVRETLRLMPPLHSTIRMATRDEVLHASEDITLRDGTVTREFAIKRGQFIHIPLLPLNTLTDIWGADAKEFCPDRWLDVPETVKGMPGMLHIMSFTSGPHGCPGYKLALTEMRVFIAAAVENFEFHAVAEIGKRNAFMMRPFVRGKWAKLGVVLPLKITPVVRS
ncbi:cytochrome P450 [Auricularia subglabra TFB-10046 SS5]|nr:cytochrome P450 [Auricularia subglabra TFB-10046 SS5]